MKIMSHYGDGLFIFLRECMMINEDEPTKCGY